jgi:glycerate kinase
MRVLIAPDSFKGSISATSAAEAIARGWRKVRPSDELVIRPLADGGEGTLEALHYRHGGSYQSVSVFTPDDQEISSQWLLLNDGTAVVELASSSGLPLMKFLAPLTAHTYGFGQLLRAAASDPRTKRIVATVGGSASTDGGVGALKALGVKFLDVDGEDIVAGGIGLLEISSIDTQEVITAPSGGVLLLTDVTNPLLGEKGTSRVFAPQKGANESDVTLLEEALTHFSHIIGSEASTAGSGAAGGTAFGLHALWGSQITSGSEYIFSALGIADEVDSADLIITGEGSLDSQSFDGKVIGSLSTLTQKAGKKLWAIVGVNNSSHLPESLSKIISLSDCAGNSNSAYKEAGRWLEVAGRDAALLYVESN